MLKQELIHSHILVAILCGWEPQKPNKEFPNGSLFLSTGNTPEDQHELSNDVILEELPYATDWNYFHTAWDVFKEAYVELSQEERGEMGDVMINIENAILDSDKELAFNELVRGINCINQLNLQET